MELLDGKALADEILAELKNEISSKKIKISVILAGNNPASETYVRIKEKRCREAGIGFELIRYNEDVSQEEIIDKISRLNKDKEINGILVQLPLPAHLKPDEIVNKIIPEKDVDGLTTANREKLNNGDERIVCCAPKGIVRMLERKDIELDNKRIVIVGHGFLVGKPLEAMLKNRNLNFEICDIFTKDLKERTRKADILITATGSPHLIKEDFVKEGVIIIDAGTAKLGDKIVGDVDFDDVSKKASLITPVPGGVGPMTVAMLVENIVESYKMQKNI